MTERLSEEGTEEILKELENPRKLPENLRERLKIVEKMAERGQKSSDEISFILMVVEESFNITGRPGIVVVGRLLNKLPRSLECQDGHVILCKDGKGRRMRAYIERPVKAWVPLDTTAGEGIAMCLPEATKEEVTGAEVWWYGFQAT